MKVTALIPDNLITDVKKLSQSKTLTKALIKALSEWVAHQKLQKKHQRLIEEPLEFLPNFSAETIRELNRRKR